MIPLTYHSLALVSSNIHPSREIDLWGCNIMIHTFTHSSPIISFMVLLMKVVVAMMYDDENVDQGDLERVP